jgi:hypothetical protein
MLARRRLFYTCGDNRGNLMMDQQVIGQQMQAISGYLAS